MLKHLQKMLLIVALLVPWVTQAQVTCTSGTPDTATNLPDGVSATSTSQYFPGYSYYNYSYSEVIVPSSQLEDAGVVEIKALMFKPNSTTAGSYFNNCTIYLANTTVDNLSSGFIQSVSDFEEVYAGSLNYNSTDWQTVVFDNSFMWDGSSNIVVAVKRDHGSYTSGSSFVAFSASSSLGRYVYNDESAYTIGSITGGTATSTVSWYKFVGCAGGEVSCNRVRSLAASEITSDGFTLTWIDTLNTGATYTIYDMSDTSVVASNISGNTYIVSGLNGNTVYTFAVVADCGGGDVSNFSKVVVRTACSGLEEMPYSYSFEDAPTGSSSTSSPFDVPCWTRLNNGTFSGGYPYLSSSSSYCHTGSRGLYWYNSITMGTYGDYQCLVLPAINTDEIAVNALRLKFWARASSADYQPVFHVGVMTDPNDISTFTSVTTVNVQGTDWAEYEGYLSAYEGTGNYIALCAYRPTSSWYAYLDDFTIDYLPSCPHVANLSVDSVSTDFIGLSWVPSGSESEWLIYVNGEPVGTSTYEGYEILNLDLNTEYTIGVASLCGQDDTSEVMTVTAHTLASQPISEFPYSCGFEITEDEEDEASVWVLENGSQTNAWSVGSAVNNGGSRALYVSNDNGTSNSYTISISSNVWAYADFYFAPGQYFISFDWKGDAESCCDYLKTFLVPGSVSPVSGSSSAPAGSIQLGGNMNDVDSWQTETFTFTITDAGAYKLAFLWHNDGSVGSQPPAAIDNLVVSQLTCPAPVSFVIDTISAFEATFEWTSVGEETEWAIRAISAAGTDEWQQVTSNPYTYTGLISGTSYTFELVAVCGDDDSSLIVTCYGSTPVTCPDPTDFNVTVDDATASASFTWVDNNGSNWDFVYGEMGFNPYNSDDIVNTSSTSHQITNLDTGFYEAYVRTNCGDNDFSGWVGPLTFSYGVTLMNMSTSGYDTIYACTAIIYDDGGPNGSYSSNCQSQLVILPSTPGSDVLITGVSYTESTYDYIRIYEGIGTDGEQLWNDYGVSATQTFGPFSAEAITVVFISDNSVQYDGFQINVSCTAPTSCHKPTNLSSNPSISDSVVVSWVENGESTSWEIVVGAPGFVPDTAEDIIVTTDPYYVFNNLQGGVSYQVYVRSNCGNEYSNWAGPLSFVPGQFVIGTSGSGSVTMCGGVIYDDGGPNGQYSNNADYQLTVYPTGNDQMLTFQGTAYTESSIDYLKIYEGVGTNGTLLWSTSNSSQQDVIPLTTCMTGPITLHFHTDGSVVYDGFALQISCTPAPQCAAVENLAVNAGPTSAIVTWDEGFFGTYSGATVEYKEDIATTWTSLPMVNTTYATITGLTPATNYNLRVISNCEGFDGEMVTANFLTGRFPCLLVDSSSIQTVIDTIGNGTATSNYFPSYSFYNYGLTQQIFTPDEIGHGGTISSIAFKMSAVNQQRTYEIYMGHTTDATASQFLNPTDLTLVYNGGAVNMVADQWTTFTLTTPFAYNGVENLVIFFRDLTGSYVSGNYSYGTTGASGVSRYVYQDGSAYTVGSTTGGTSSNFRCNFVFVSTDFGCLLSDSCAAPVAAVTDVTTNSALVVWAPGFAETSWTVCYRQKGETTWSSPVTVTTTNHLFTNLNSGFRYEFKVECVCNNEPRASVVEATTLCASISTLPFYETFNTWGVGVLPNCWYNTGAYSTTNYSIISASQNMSGTTGGSIYMYSSSTASYISRIIAPGLDSTLFQANQTQVVFSVNYTSTSYGQPTFVVGVMDDPNNVATFTPVDTVQHSANINVWETFEVPLSNYTGTGSYIAIQTLYPGTYFYCYLDNFTIEMIPTCPRPDSLMASNATSNSVDLSWHERGSANQWIVEYGPRGFTPGTGAGTTVNAYSNPFTLMGLPASYQGEFYVKSVCSSTDVGEYSRMGCLFGTTQIPATLPYDNNFENATEWANWQTCSNTSIDWFRGSAVANGGSNSMYVSADNGATYTPYQFNSVVNAAVYRDVDFGTVDSSFTMSFDARAGGNLGASYDGLMVFLVDPAISPEASNSNITSPWGNVNNLYRIASVRIDTNWNTYTCSFDTISGIKRVAFFWFNQSTGNESSYGPSLLEPAAVDNIHIDYSPCPRPVAVTVNSVGASSANISWYGPSSATYEVIYRQYPNGTNNFIQTNTNSITLTGLESMAQYVVWVRKLCGNDTSMTSDGRLFTTEMCDNAMTFMNYDTTLTTATSSYSPVGYSYYNYSYVQTIVDSAYLAGMTGDITAMSFVPTDASGGDEYQNMTVYLANVSESDLSAGWILPDDSSHIFVKVIDNADFSYTSAGVQTHGFDTTFTWDEHSNILVSVVRNNGSWTSGSSFEAHNHDVAKARYASQDGSPYDYTNPSSTGTAITAVGDIYLITCGAGCRAPQLQPVTNLTYSSVTLNWSGITNDYEIAVKAVNEASYPAPTAVNGNSFNVTGLQPATLYRYEVRAICDASEGLISDWVEGTFTTNELPCFAPTNLHAIASTYTSVTLDWTVGGNESNWSIRIWDANFDTTVVVNARPATIGGLNDAWTYNATVSALCGDASMLIESEESEATTFQTQTCQPVSGLTITNITSSSAVVTWNGSASSYTIEYGPEFFGVNTGQRVTGVTGNSYTINNLESSYTYDVYVRAECEPGVSSAWGTKVSFTTLDGGGEAVDVVDGMMNLSIYPNPTRSSATVALSGVNGEVTVTVVDMNGRVVKAETMSCSGDCTKRMDVEELAQGAYFVRVNGENINMVKKLIVK